MHQSMPPPSTQYAVTLPQVLTPRALGVRTAGKQTVPEHNPFMPAAVLRMPAAVLQMPTAVLLAFPRRC